MKTLFHDELHAHRTARRAQETQPDKKFIVDQVIWGYNAAWIIYILDTDDRIVGRL